MRFNDSLTTVLSADAKTGVGARSTWRQLVDLIGRGRAPADEPSIARLRMLRQAVPGDVRAASARALAFANPGAAIVGLFAEDELAIAAPVLRTAMLADAEWIALLPRLTPAGRSVLRHRRDLTATVARGLESFGSTDFVLGHAKPVPEPVSSPPAAANDAVIPAVPIDAPFSETPFVALGDVARGLPVVAEALRRAEPVETPHRFEISDLVARIDAFQRDRPIHPAPAPDPPLREGFHYETDAAGTIQWVEGVPRAMFVGLSLVHSAVQGLAQVDGVAPGAFRRRSRFVDARLAIAGSSAASGAWRLTGVPAFDPATGRFEGFRGTARRPRADEAVGPTPAAATAADSLRQLLHELRTPTNAIAGFAELIETELLGPVPPTYRDRATAIRNQAGDLLAAIDDLDTAARLEGHALELRPTTVALLPLLERIVRDLQPLAGLRGVRLMLDPASVELEALGDDRAIERLIGRLLSAITSCGSADERIEIRIEDADPPQIAIARPRSLEARSLDTLLAIDDVNDVAEGAPLLGTGFALRLARNLAAELGGSLSLDAERLTLRLPAASDRPMGRTTTS